MRTSVGVSVVSYRNSTSNHNTEACFIKRAELYLIEILHQTTTVIFLVICLVLLYLIEILHQTTTKVQRIYKTLCCILSKFYIKPQHFDFSKRINYSCILSKFYIKPQRWGWLSCGCSVVSYRNSTSNHNDVRSNPLAVPVVSYRNSTSNHNSRAASTISAGLYLIEILHQTTTKNST